MAAIKLLVQTIVVLAALTEANGWCCEKIGSAGPSDGGNWYPPKRPAPQVCWIANPKRCDTASRYRTIDGSCNNIRNPKWGQSLRLAGRQLEANCGAGNRDGPRMKGVRGRPLPSTRKVSTTVHQLLEQQDLSASKLTVMHMTWGQFIDHDMSHLPMPPPFPCCGVPADQLNPECISIPIPDNDPEFTRSCMELRRTIHAKPGQCGNKMREQINNITSYIDGSNIYGNWESRANNQREFRFGMLATTESRKLLPIEKAGTACDIPPNDPDKRCFMAGDKRANEQGGLTAVHVAFSREHNRIAQIFYPQVKKALWYLRESQIDEIVYQETRRIIGALIQVINYSEYVPKFLGEAEMHWLGLHIQQDLTRRSKPVYNPRTDATVSNAFATAAFRFGHSQIGFGIQPRTSTFQNSSNFVSWDELFNQPTSYRMFENDNLLRGMMVQPTAVVKKFSPETRDKLHLKTFSGLALDLPAINSQRGRDHCLPSYIAWRRWCGLRPVTFSYMPDHTKIQRQAFSQLYDHPDDIDLFPAAVTERHIAPDAEVGPTFACMLGDQFKRLKEGDRFWFEHQDTYPHPFTTDQINQLSKIKLSKVICETTPDTDYLPRDSFLVNSPFVHCQDLPGLDLQRWLDFDKISQNMFG